MEKFKPEQFKDNIPKTGEKPEIKHYSSREEYQKNTPIVGEEFSISVDEINKRIFSRGVKYFSSEGEEITFPESAESQLSAILNSMALQGKNISLKMLPDSHKWMGRTFIMKFEITVLDNEGKYAGFQRRPNLAAKYIIEFNRREEPKGGTEGPGDKTGMAKITSPNGKSIKITERSLLHLRELQESLNSPVDSPWYK